jgi:group II intron reverse transcriptase/maturase
MQPAANVTSGDPLDWHAIDWKQVYRRVRNLRQRIFRASRDNDLKKVRSLQRLMLRCRANVLVSVRRVTQVNHGKDTPGVDAVLITTPEERAMLCTQLSQLDRHQAHPVRRVYIPKRQGKRPLGLPAIRDRIVQAAVAQVLDAIYEPLFRKCSYGFRPRRNTIQALRHVAQAYRAGATWIIEGDLVKCFDSIPHGVILNALRKRIKDERFVDLVRKMLTAGVMEEGQFQPTYSGTPQGGLASPILSNVVLHEFDSWLEDHWQANPPRLTAQQQHTRANREYARHKRNLVRWRAQLHGRLPMGRQTPEGLQAKITHALAARKRIPSVTSRRLISYCRYADDYVVVLCQHTKVEAQHLKTALAQWLQEHLGLTQHPEKTRLTHWDDRFRFLGYDLRGQRNPNGTRWLRLSIPPEKERDVKAKVKRLCGYTQIPELDLFMSVNALLRGWTTYFRYANNATNRFLYLTGVVYWLTAHYLGRKHRCSIRRLMRIHYGWTRPVANVRCTRRGAKASGCTSGISLHCGVLSSVGWLGPKMCSRYRSPVGPEGTAMSNGCRSTTGRTTPANTAGSAPRNSSCTIPIGSGSCTSANRDRRM